MNKENVIVYDTVEQVAKQVAQKIAELILQKQKAHEKCVLCLPTGSTPIPVYKELVRMHREEGLSFKNVISFNLDEYYPMAPDDKNSYHYFMNENLFQHVDIPKDQIHIPDGTVPMDKVKKFCESYEAKIRELGPIDLAFVGVGRNGHIGFNEPPSYETDRTRMITLHRTTIEDTASVFGGEEHVPRNALTMGVGTILDCKQVILVATGKRKAETVRKFVQEDLSDYSLCPAAYLRKHKNAQFYFDKEAAQYLTL
jgi:glucosamine-6-phosphate deaminase